MQKRIINILSGVFVLLLLVVSSQSVKAQSATDLKLNEVLVINEANYIDDFGNHSPWLEIFNSSYGPVDIGGCYLTDDLNNPKKYWIPVGDPATKIPPRCYIVFWGDGNPTRGIFHLNFNFDNAKTIALYNANGRSLIDKVDLPQDHKADVTYGLPTTESTEWQYLSESTPGANNDHTHRASSGEKFVEMDPSGFGITVIAMMVVFSALAILYFIYSTIGKIFIRKANASKTKESVSATSEKREVETMSGEVNAAIATALFMYQNEMHDYEDAVLTIKKVSKAYSPWSSKIYTLRKTPR